MLGNIVIFYECIKYKNTLHIFNVLKFLPLSQSPPLRLKLNTLRPSLPRGAISQKNSNIQVSPKTLPYVLSIIEAYNRALIVHRVSDPNQNNLLDQRWEIFDPILSCTNQQLLPTFFLNQSDEITSKFKIRESGLSLCVVP